MSLPQAGVPAQADACVMLLRTPVLCLCAQGRRARWWNPAAAAWLGLRGEPGAVSDGPDLAAALPPHEWDGWQQVMRRAMQQSLQHTAGPAASDEGVAWHRLTAGVPRTWCLQVQPWDGGWLAQAWPVGAEGTTQAETSLAQAQASRRDLLVREVHHRLKNNLQGVAGLLGRLGDVHPELREPVRQAVSQIQSVAEVYGVQVQGAGAPTVHALLTAVSRAARGIFGAPVVVHAPEPVQPHVSSTSGHEGPDMELRGLLWAHLDVGAASPHAVPAWCVNEDDATPVALCLNELITNAIKHGRVGHTIECEAHVHAGGVTVEIRNLGSLPPGFALEGLNRGVSGLGLVKSLMPRRGARLELLQEGEKVCARLHIGPPCVQALVDTATQSVS